MHEPGAEGRLGIEAKRPGPAAPTGPEIDPMYQMQYRGDAAAIKTWSGDPDKFGERTFQDASTNPVVVKQLVVKTALGYVLADVGDWVTKDEAGNFAVRSLSEDMRRGG